MELLSVLITLASPVLLNVPDAAYCNVDDRAWCSHGWISTCDRRAIKSSSGRCVVDNVCGVAVNPESFTCYDTKVERNTVLAHVRGLRVSRGLPTLPERLPAQLCGVTSQTSRHWNTAYISLTFRPDQQRNHTDSSVGQSPQTHAVCPNFVQTELPEFKKSQICPTDL